MGKTQINITHNERNRLLSDILNLPLDTFNTLAHAIDPDVQKSLRAALLAFACANASHQRYYTDLVELWLDFEMRVIFPTSAAAADRMVLRERLANNSARRNRQSLTYGN